MTVSIQQPRKFLKHRTVTLKLLLNFFFYVYIIKMFGLIGGVWHAALALLKLISWQTNTSMIHYDSTIAGHSSHHNNHIENGKEGPGSTCDRIILLPYNQRKRMATTRTKEQVRQYTKKKKERESQSTTESTELYHFIVWQIGTVLKDTITTIVERQGQRTQPTTTPTTPLLTILCSASARPSQCRGTTCTHTRVSLCGGLVLAWWWVICEI